MIKTTAIMFVVFALLACQQEESIEIKQLEIVDLNSINSEYWDSPSKVTLAKFRKTQVENLSYSQSKQLAEIFIVHDSQKQAIAVLQQLDYSKSQYLAYLLATAYYKNGEPKKSLELVQTENFPSQNSSLLNLKYKILLELGLPETIILLANSDKTLNDFSNTLSKYYLAMAYLQNNNCKKAIPLFKQVLTENPTANKVYAPLANAYQQCKKAQAAEVARKKQGTRALSNTDEFYDRLLKNGDPVSYSKQLLNTALDRGNKKNIIEISEKLIKFNAADSTLLNNYAISLYQSGRLGQTNKALLEAVELDKTNIKSLQLLFEFNRVKNIEIAEKAIDQLIAIDPNNTLYIKAKNYIKEQQRQAP